MGASARGLGAVAKAVARDPVRLLLLMLGRVRLLHLYNHLFSRPQKADAEKAGVSGAPEELGLLRVRSRTAVPKAISDHLEVLYIEALLSRPALIVELGVREGHSTYALEQVARVTGGTLVSVDIAPTTYVSDYPKWHFVQRDDCEFAREFPQWCKEHGVDPEVDVLFIDTSHVFEHTRNEIASWFPYLSRKGKVFFHDTNLKPLVKRRNGAILVGWNNGRGVIRAIEEFLGCRYDETRPFVDLRNGWVIRHDPVSAGMTILTRVD